MRTLAVGDKGTDVTFVQRLLNRFSVENSPGNYLTPDADFGPRTEKAVIAFQEWRSARYGSYFSSRGRVCGETWRSLGAASGISHSVRLVAQYSNTTCWEACMNMLLGSSKCREMPASMLAPNRLLLDDVSALRTYAGMLGRRLIGAPSSVRALASLLAPRPAVLLGRAPRYTGGGHAVVISALWTDKDVSEDLTVLRVHNPSPINRGRIESSSYPLMECERDSFKPVWLIA